MGSPISPRGTCHPAAAWRADARAAQPSGPHDQHARGPQPALPEGAEVRQQQVSRVARALLRRELRARRHPRGSCHGATLTTRMRRIRVARAVTGP